MPLILWLLIAFLAGVLLEWALEIFFFRRRMFQQIEIERAAKDLWRAKFEMSQSTLSARETELGNVRATAVKLQTDLDTCAHARANLEQEKTSLQTRASQLENDLNSALQNQAEVKATLQMRETDLSQLRADLEDHLAQNKNLTADIAKFTADTATATATLTSLQGDKTGLEQQIAELKAQLGRSNANLNAALNAKTNTENQLAELKTQFAKTHSELRASVDARVQSDLGLKAREAEIAKLRADLDGYLSQNKNLSPNGVRLTAETKTASATIQTVKHDQAASPSIETDLATLRNRREGDETPFQVACPQHLSDVKGIGTVFEQRLYDAGIGSYWQLSQLSNDRLTEILQVTGLQSKQTDYEAIRADARRLAKETKSLGREWSRGKPDDFEPLEGIGHTFEKRLYDAGICTYEGLANTTVAQLEEICHAPAQFKPDYASWIKQAQELVMKRNVAQG